MKHLKLYATVKPKREHWKTHVYRTVLRKPNGRFAKKYPQKWSPKRPIRPVYTEQYFHKETTQELETEIQKYMKKYKAVKYVDLCYNELTHEWEPC